MIFELFITLLLVSLNGFFVASEFAIVKVRASQLELKANQGNRSARLGKHIVEHLDGYLAATQLGITLASLGLGWIGEPVVSKIIIRFMVFIGMDADQELAHHIALPVAFAIITILHIVFGELAPKSIAIQRSEGTTLATAFPLHVFYIIFRPFIFVLNGIANMLLKLIGISAQHGSEVHSSDELKYLMQQGKESGMIEATNYDIIRNAFSFSGRTARQIMKSRTQVIGIDLNDFNEGVLEKVLDEGFSRIPCYEDTLDNITGVVYMKDILLALRKHGKINIREFVRPVMIIPESKRIGALLKDFQVKHQQFAVVVNEYGGTKGIITMEDILEELVGEIQDEYDNEVPFVEKVGDSTYKVLASATMDDVNELLPHPLEKDESYETLAGKLILKFGRIPNQNEKIIFDDYEFTILKKSRSTISLVELKDLKPEVEGSGDENNL